MTWAVKSKSKKKQLNEKSESFQNHFVKSKPNQNRKKTQRKIEIIEDSFVKKLNSKKNLFDFFYRNRNRKIFQRIVSGKKSFG